MFDFLFNPQGRVSRKGIWLFLLFSFLAQLAASVADLMTAGTAQGPIAAVLTLFLLWPSIAVTVKRFHDRNMSGWWIIVPMLTIIAALAILVMSGLFAAVGGALNEANGGAPSSGAGFSLVAIIVGLVVAGVLLHQFVVLYLLPGSRGSNTYGMDPRAPSRGFKGADGDREGDDPWKPIDRLKPKKASAFPDTFQPRPQAPAEPAPARRRNAAGSQPEWGFGRMHPSRR